MSRPATLICAPGGTDSINTVSRTFTPAVPAQPVNNTLPTSTDHPHTELAELNDIFMLPVS